MGPAGELEAYYLARSIDHQPFRAACYAPFVAMSFDMTGAVSVCAFTRSSPLGRIGETSLMDMWRGARIESLRAAVASDDLSAACARCAEEIAGGNVHGVLASGFDVFPAARSPDWPTRMEFALSNRCNLQCVMCSGEFSSAIRTRREGLPALPERYGEEFLSELDPFLPHLEQARFLGGEPFLAEINYRIWERMIELGLGVDCNVTTNGTCWTPRMERMLDALPFSIGISIDGVTRQTVESVRCGASFDQVMDNLGRFVAYRDRTGSSLSLTFCLMRENWHEFVDYLRLADRLDCQVFVNTVRQPPMHSLYHLDPDELNLVIESLASDAANGPALERNSVVFVEQHERLRRHLAAVKLHGSPAVGSEVRRRADALLAAMSPDAAEESIVDALRRAASDGLVWVLRCDGEDTIVDGAGYVGLEIEQIVGRPASVVHPMLADRLGRSVEVLGARSGGGMSARALSFVPSAGTPTVVLSVTRRGPAPYATTRFAIRLTPVPP